MDDNDDVDFFFIAAVDQSPTGAASQRWTWMKEGDLNKKNTVVLLLLGDWVGLDDRSSDRK